MKIVKTVQLQIVDGKDGIVETIRHYVPAMNFASEFARSSGVFGKNAMQARIYQDIRDRFGIRSQMTINVLGDVAAQYKGEHRDNRTRVNKDGTPRSVTFKSLSMHLNYPRDYGFKGNDIVSINTLEGRTLVPCKMGAYHRTILDSGEWEIKSSTLTYRKRDGVLFLNVAVEKEIPESKMIDRDGIVGIDLGITNIAVATGTNGKTAFHGGGTMKLTRYRYFKARQGLQRLGTRAAKRKLRALTGRERRFVANENHCIAKEIINNAIGSFTKPAIVMEDLTGVRKNPRKSSRGTRELNSWSYFQLQQFIEYKALERGVPVIYIDPAYTSQACCRCGHVERANRDKARHRFECRACHYQSNDDRVASINIRDRGVATRYIREARGIVNCPIVAGDDAETSSDGLMRNLVTSPRL
jgi:IS605 OrfB family transposase